MTEKRENTAPPASIPEDGGLGHEGRMLCRGWPLLAIPVTILGLAMAWALYELSGDTEVALTQRVEQDLRLTGLENPVTAVLMNFRGYDTLLEIIALLLAVIGVASLGGLGVFAERDPQLARPPADPLLRAMVRIVIPLMLVVGGYVLWEGTAAPGGAFQGGAIVGAAGVLWLLAGVGVPWWFRGWRLRLALVVGTAVFLAVGVIVVFFGMQFLEFRAETSKRLILLIETAAMLSIGVVFTVLFAGVLPPMTSAQAVGDPAARSGTGPSPTTKEARR